MSDRLSCSFFCGAKDNRPRPWSGAWPELVEILKRTNAPKAGLTGGEAKRSLPAICAATFRVGTTRALCHVEAVHLLLIDFDNSREDAIPGEFHLGRDGDPTNRPKTRKVRLLRPVDPRDVLEAVEASGHAAYLWTTWSSQPDWSKFRLCVPWAQPVPVDLWERATEAALERLGLATFNFRAGIDLPVLRNAAALAFLPGAPDPSSIQRAEVSGRPLVLDLEALAAMRPSAPDMKPWQEHISREQAATGKDWFRGYRVGGRPVDMRTVNLAAVLEGLGCRIGEPRPWKGGTKRRCSCPWASEHSCGVDDDSAVIFEAPGTWPHFHCKHSGHTHLRLRDVLEAAWGRCA